MRYFIKRHWINPFAFTHILKSFYYRFQFQHFGNSSYINCALQIDGAKYIYIGRKCSIEYKTWLAAMPLTGFEPKLVIEDGCNIGHFNHIYATKSIVLHKNVLTADKVYISDNNHDYENVNLPILQQSIVQNGEVEIGEGSWLGENVCVLGAKIGKHCIIGANSVVTKDIPDYCVAVGAPAKIIKRYDFVCKKWKKVCVMETSQTAVGGGKSWDILLSA